LARFLRKFGDPRSWYHCGLSPSVLLSLRCRCLHRRCVAPSHSALYPCHRCRWVLPGPAPGLGTVPGAVVRPSGAVVVAVSSRRLCRQGGTHPVCVTRCISIVWVRRWAVARQCHRGRRATQQHAVNRPCRPCGNGRYDNGCATWHDHSHAVSDSVIGAGPFASAAPCGEAVPCCCPRPTPQSCTQTIKFRCSLLTAAVGSRRPAAEPPSPLLPAKARCRFLDCPGPLAAPTRC
jgi:hypothetical protein